MTAKPPNAAGRRRAALNMYSPLSEIADHPPITVPLQASVRETLQRMDEARVGFIVVADPATRLPLGVFTLRDLVHRVTLPGGDLDQPVAAVMTCGVIALEPRATAHHAALTMARHGVQHVVVVGQSGTLEGVVSQEELFGLSRLGLKEVAERIQAAADLPGLQAAAEGIRQLADTLLAQGQEAETLTHFVSTLNDLLTIRTVELTVDAHDLPPVGFCWLALGSEGRLEQTFATDQDNALVFDAPESEAEELRAAFVPFAQEVNEKLDACGFPLCQGGVMAGRSRWCLSLPEWHRTFAGWVAEPQPDALLAASTFLDFRPVYGAFRLAERLRERVAQELAGRPAFLPQLARLALESRPPLGLVWGFAYDGPPEFRRTVDLKLSGARIFSDAARALALAKGIVHTSTAQRLRALGDAGYFSTATLAGLLEGLHFIHRLRLKNQRGPRRPRVGPNRIFPSELNVLDRRLLLESLRQARSLQSCLVTEFRLQGSA